MIYNNTMYQIDITGPIGVGKSTIIESIKSHFENVVHIPEYINGDKNGEKSINENRKCNHYLLCGNFSRNTNDGSGF